MDYLLTELGPNSAVLEYRTLDAALVDVIVNWLTQHGWEYHDASANEICLKAKIKDTEDKYKYLAINKAYISVYGIYVMTYTDWNTSTHRGDPAVSVNAQFFNSTIQTGHTFGMSISKARLYLFATERYAVLVPIIETAAGAINVNFYSTNIGTISGVFETSKPGSGCIYTNMYNSYCYNVNTGSKTQALHNNVFCLAKAQQSYAQQAYQPDMMGLIPSGFNKFNPNKLNVFEIIDSETCSVLLGPKITSTGNGEPFSIVQIPIGEDYRCLKESQGGVLTDHMLVAIRATSGDVSSTTLGNLPTGRLAIPL